MIIEKFSELDELTSYLKNTERELISKALKYSEKAHNKQLRKSKNNKTRFIKIH